ncbi:hypothetical protein N799_08600 [Lysobacter arseniciresistens ZS79]|uniref:Uncharacterized protein n=1 Tax=Lysobacter arseniciresistens ZS79 TaxID=913325 RepID=A0A0A0F081_9GAMM|nr:hypothetical protein N799_08600 [Lysobacter arseniciresistens ZS79]
MQTGLVAVVGKIWVSTKIQPVEHRFFIALGNGIEEQVMQVRVGTDQIGLVQAFQIVIAVLRHSLPNAGSVLIVLLLDVVPHHGRIVFFGAFHIEIPLHAFRRKGKLGCEAHGFVVALHLNSEMRQAAWAGNAPGEVAKAVLASDGFLGFHIGQVQQLQRVQWWRLGVDIELDAIS